MLRPMVAVACAMTLGCGDNLAPTIAIEDLEAERLAAECTYLTRCGLFPGPGIEACLAFSRVIIDHHLHAAVQAGVVAYDGERAATCVELLAARSCNRTEREARILPACRAMFVGTIADGGACALDQACASGACEVPPCADACCTGTCAPTRAPALEGGACHHDDDCTDDAYCTASEVCAPRVAVGGPCTSDAACAFGAACIGAGIEPGACRSLPLLGEPCPYLRCAEVAATCSPAQVCVSTGHGAPCASDADCSFYGLCDLATARCGAIPTLDMECTTRCAGDAWCDRSAAPARCAAQLPDGALCMTGDQCASYFCEAGPAFDACAEPQPCF